MDPLFHSKNGPMNKHLGIIALLLIAGFGINQWLTKSQADQVISTIDQHAEQSTQRTLAVVSDTASAVIRDQFTQEREARQQAFGDIVSAVDEAASNAVASQFEIERATNKAIAKEQRRQGLQHVYIAEGLQLAGTAKVAVAEFFMVNDRFPRSNREAGLPEPTQFSGQALTSLVISFDGEIILNYNKKSGVHRGMIRLTPDVRATHMIKWQCKSRNFRSINQMAPGCEFDPYA